MSLSRSGCGRREYCFDSNAFKIFWSDLITGSHMTANKKCFHIPLMCHPTGRFSDHVILFLIMFDFYKEGLQQILNMESDTVVW